MKDDVQKRVIKLLAALENLRRKLMIHMVSKNQFIKKDGHIFATIAFSISEDVLKFNDCLKEAKELPVEDSFIDKLTFSHMQELDFEDFTLPVSTFAADENEAKQIQNEIFSVYQNSIVSLIHNLSIEYSIAWEFDSLESISL